MATGSHPVKKHRVLPVKKHLFRPGPGPDLYPAMQMLMEKRGSRAERSWRGVPVSAIYWWAALLLCMACLLGLNTVLDA